MNGFQQKHISVFSNCFKRRTDYFLKAVDIILFPKIGIPWLFVQTAGIHLLICSLVIFLNEDRNNQSLEANLVFTEDSQTIWECFMQTSKHGLEEQPKHNQVEAQAFFQGMSKAFLSDGQSQLYCNFFITVTMKDLKSGLLSLSSLLSF